MKTWIKMGALALQVALVGCGGAQKTDVRNPEDESAQAPRTPGSKAPNAEQQAEKAEKAEEPTKELPPPKPAAQKKLSKADRAEFDAAVAKWDAAKKAGPISREMCKSLAGTFADIAGSHKGVAAEAHFNAGTLLETCASPKEGEAEYQAALQANPSFGPAMNNIGEIYFRQGNPTTAKMWFEKAIAADPRRVSHAYANLAVIQYQNARDGDASMLKEAVTNLRRALAIDGESMAAYSLLALIYYNTAESDRSKLQLAELVCKQAKDVNDKYAPIYNTLGLIQLRRRNVTGALLEFEKAIQLDPKYVEAHLNIGAIGLSSRSYAKAEASFQAVLRLQPNNFDATVGMGVAARGQKKIDEAEKWYKKAAELDPKNCAVPYNLGLLYQDYKGSDVNDMKQAQTYYAQYASCGRTDKVKLADAQRRIKDIDDTFAAMEQQKKMEAELKQQQEQMQQQQKQMEEQQKQQAPKTQKTDAPAADAKPASNQEEAAPAEGQKTK